MLVVSGKFKGQLLLSLLRWLMSLTIRNDMIMRFPEQYRSYKRKVRMFGPIWLWVALFFIVLALVGCATTPKLTPEDRKRDIQFLADWARDYSPIVKLAEEQKDNPSYEALLPKYLQYAEQAQSDKEFYKVARGYYNLICSHGHGYLVPESEFKWGKALYNLRDNRHRHKSLYGRPGHILVKTCIWKSVHSRPSPFSHCV